MADKYINEAGLSAVKEWFLGQLQIRDDEIAALNVAVEDLEVRVMALEGRDIPDEYIKITGLKATGNEPYIDTGLTFDGALAVSIEGCTATNSAAVLFDAYKDSSTRMGGIFYNRARPRYDRWWAGVGYAEHDTTGIDLSKKFLLQQTRTGISLTQESVTTASSYSGTTATDTTLPIWLFKSKRTGISSETAIIYSARFEKAGELLRNFVPVKRIADDALGMYDKVTREFFGNAGSGAFTIA